MAVYGYARVSTDRQADEGESLEVQERQLKGWSLMQGEELAEVHVDRGVSGSTPLQDRVAGGALLSRVKAGDTIVAAKLDRLFRSALDALQTVEAMQARRVRIVLLDSLGDITGNGMAKAFLTIAAAFAELERDQIRERVTGVKRDQRQRGRYLGGKVPFGFSIREEHDGDGKVRKLLTHCEVEQQIIAEVRRMKKSGKTLRAIQSAIEAKRERWIGLATLKRIADEAAD
jgi:DNA invertase Pin-like site-specific DNA recombinase